MPLPATSQPIAFVLTRDRALSLPFYTQVLGLKLISQNEYAAVLDAFGMTLRLSTVEGHTAAPHPVFGWAVPDLPAVMRDLSARDVQFQVYEGFGQDAQGIWTSSDGKTRISWFLDPEGNVLSLTEA